MKLNHETLAAVGQALYGNQWHTALAGNLGVNVRTMRRWAKGEFDIPGGVWPELRKLCWLRSADIETLARQLPREV